MFGMWALAAARRKTSTHHVGRLLAHDRLVTTPFETFALGSRSDYLGQVFAVSGPSGDTRAVQPLLSIGRRGELENRSVAESPLEHLPRLGSDIMRLVDEQVRGPLRNCRVLDPDFDPRAPKHFFCRKQMDWAAQGADTPPAHILPPTRSATGRWAVKRSECGESPARCFPSRCVSWRSTDRSSPAGRCRSYRSRVR